MMQFLGLTLKSDSNPTANVFNGNEMTRPERNYTSWT